MIESCPNPEGRSGIGAYRFPCDRIDTAGPRGSIRPDTWGWLPERGMPESNSPVVYFLPRRLCQDLKGGFPTHLALPISGKVNFYRETVQPTALDRNSHVEKAVNRRLLQLPSGGWFRL